MQDYSRQNLNALAGSWKVHNKNTIWAKKQNAISKYLGEIKKIVKSFNEKENEFLQNLYINLSDGNLRSTEILKLGEKFDRAELFFSNTVLNQNLDGAYYDFVFREKLIALKDYFSQGTATRVFEILSGDNKNIVSLYVFLENIAKNFNTSVQDKSQRDQFKIKIVKFYDLLFRLFYSINSTFVPKFFKLVLHNQPFVLIEFVNTAIFGEMAEQIEIYCHDESLLNFSVVDEKNFAHMSKDELYEIASIFTQASSNLPTTRFLPKEREILETLYEKKIENFGDFFELNHTFLEEFMPYPSEISTMDQLIFASLFFEYIANASSDDLTINTMFFGAIGSGKSHKLKEIILRKNLNHNRFKYISLHENYHYSDFVDGFVEGKFYNGELKQICKNAMKDSANDYYLVIDNASNGKFDEIFGEISELLENRYDEKNPFSLIRTKNSHIIDKFDNDAKDEFSVVVKDGNSYFALPKNLYILCATNGLNYGISASMAASFNWVKMDCNYAMLEHFLTSAGIKNASAFVTVCKKFNEFISKDSRWQSEIGHGIFMKISKFANSGVITQDGLDKFFAEILRPILVCGFSTHQDVAMSKQLELLKENFKI